jgi:uncharacterized protein (DUF1778 family)
MKISDSPRRVAPPVTDTAGIIRGMTERRRAKPRRSTYKGERELIGTKVSPEFQAKVDRAAAAAGVSRSDWILDAVVLGLARRDELVELLGQIWLHRGDQMIPTRVSPQLKKQVDKARNLAGTDRGKWILAALLLRLEHPVEMAALPRVGPQPAQLSFDTPEVLGESA